DPFEQIGNERGAIFGGQVGVDLAESENVIVRGIIWQLNSGDDDRPIRSARFYLVDDRLQIVSNFRDRHTAKRVVDAELENEDVDLAFKMTGQAVQSAVGRLTGLTSVGDFKAQIGRSQFLGQQRRISLSRSQAEPLRQTVAEKKDPFHQ